MAASAKTYKCVVVGNDGCGKRCLLFTFTTNTFPEEYVPTVFDNTDMEVVVDGKPNKLRLWDTSGQRDYDRQLPLSFKETDVFLLVFSVVDPRSFESVSSFWAPDIRHHCPDVPILLVGTKIDLRDDPETLEEHRKKYGRGPITFEQGVAKAREIGAVGYLECSAKTRKGVDVVFEQAARSAIDPRRAFFKFCSKHVFQKGSVHGKCKVCGEKFKGLIKKGMVCSKCGGMVHEGCVSQAQTEQAQRHAAAEEARHKRAAEEEASRKTAEEEDARRKAAEEARRKAIAKEEDARRKAAAKEEASRKTAEEEDARRKAAEEARRKAIAKEEEERRKAIAKEEEERRKAITEEDARRKAAEQLKAAPLPAAKSPTKQSSVADVCRWLGSIGLGEITGCFETNRIDGSVLFELTEADMPQIGITAFGHKKKLLSAIREIHPAPSPSPGVAAAVPSPTAAATPQQQEGVLGRMSLEQANVGVVPFPTFPAGYAPKCSVHAAVARAMGAKWPAAFAATLRGMVDRHVASTQRVRDAIAQHGLSKEEARAIAYYCADARMAEGGTIEMSVFRELNSTLATRRTDKAAAWHDFAVVLDSGLRKLPPFEGELYRGLDRPLTQLSRQYQAGNQVCWVAFTSCSKNKNCLKTFAGSVEQGTVSKGTWISLKVSSARDISELSFFPAEEEVLLLPNTIVRVEEIVASPEMKALINFPANLDLVRIVEIQDAH